MSRNLREVEIRRELQARIAQARRQTDRLFDLVRPEAFYARPIPERHRIVFYLGHLEAFDWNLLGRHVLDLKAFDAGFDRLFAFGIDPVDGRLPADQPGDWPERPLVERYVERAREELDHLLATVSLEGKGLPLLEDGYIIHVLIEHRLMHAETLAYMLHQLSPEQKVPGPELWWKQEASPRDRAVRIPEGWSTLGQRRGEPASFGWDNEFDLHRVKVPAFEIDRHNVTNGDFLRFVQEGCYDDRSLWTEDGWQWKEASGVRHPASWRRRGEAWHCRTMFHELPVPADWPVYVSHAEATAYARWLGKTLPTEAQFHRAAFGTPEGGERDFPWGDSPPSPGLGNFGFGRWDPEPVGAYPEADSAFGVSDLVGNGWEWTSTPFEPLPGFEPFSFYRGYSADFFDGRHYVLKGGSARTAACLLRRSFRNWFQPQYPYLYAAFRCVEGE